MPSSDMRTLAQGSAYDVPWARERRDFETSPFASVRSAHRTTGSISGPSSGHVRAPVNTDSQGMHFVSEDSLPAHLRPRIVEIERSQSPSYVAWPSNCVSRPAATYAPPPFIYQDDLGLRPGSSGSFVGAAAAQSQMSPFACQAFSPLPPATTLPGEPLAAAGTSTVVERMLHGHGAAPTDLPPTMTFPNSALQRPGQTSEVVQAMLGQHFGAP